MVHSVSLLPHHTYAKTFPKGAGEFKKVCLSVCLCVCASLLQSQITFDILGGWQTYFEGLLNSLQVIFG